MKEHAMCEFKSAGRLNDKGKWSDDFQQVICEQILELLELFSKHNHSGNTAPYAIDLFKKLAAFEIIVPLTGKDNEWIKIGNNTWQNKRCSHVFKDTNGKAYDIFGKIIREPNGCCYTNKDSNVFIEFPYTPKREYIEMSRTISE